MAFQEIKKIVTCRQQHRNCMGIASIIQTIATIRTAQATVTTVAERLANCTVLRRTLATIQRATAAVERDYMCQAAYVIHTTCIKIK